MRLTMQKTRAGWYRIGLPFY